MGVLEKNYETQQYKLTTKLEERTRVTQRNIKLHETLFQANELRFIYCIYFINYFWRIVT
jgi:hypothetical protein